MRSPGAAAATIKYRPEIDGLRTVAVVPVVLFHAGYSVFSGGFVGVDVFFVISGYLITGILLADIAAGDYSIARFYERRARRILPALFFVIACCLPFAWFTLLPDEMARFGKSILAVLGFVSNITFWREEGYFSDASEFKPLLHTWSLAVEEQFYIVFPLVLLVLRGVSRRTLTTLIALAAVISFALCEYAAQKYALANFFLAPTRAWELLGGSLCACLGRQDHQRAAPFLAWLGIALILASIFTLSGSVPFPSHWALLPVIGTMLVILFARADHGAGRILAIRPFVGIGLISYSLYLWHQPVFAFTRLSLLTVPSSLHMVLAVAVSFALAYFSWKFIEQPFRRPTGLGAPRKALPLALLGAALLAAVGVWLWAGKGLDWRFAGQAPPPVDTAARDAPARPVPGGPCTPDKDRFSFPCLLQPAADTAPRIALFGDSHAGAILPAFQTLARERGAALHVATFGGCPPLLGGFVLNGNYPADFCPSLAQSEFDYAKANRIDVVYLVGRWALYATGEPTTAADRYLLADRADHLFWTREDSRALLGRLLERTVRAYRDAGIAVIVVDQVPSQAINVKRALRWYSYQPPAGGFDKAVAESAIPIAQFQRLRATYQPFYAPLQALGASVVLTDAPFRSGERYLWATPGQIWYEDANHINRAGAALLVPALAAAFDAARAGAPIPPR